MERARLQPGERVLDVGCGSGPSTAAAATAVHPGGMVTGIDIAAPMISGARQRVGDREIEWIVGDAETYPLLEGHYDAIISQVGLMFFTNNAKAFANLARASRAGGRLVGVVWPTRDKISTFRFLFDSVRQTLDRLHIAYQERRHLILGRSRWVTIDMSNSSLAKAVGPKYRLRRSSGP